MNPHLVSYQREGHVGILEIRNPPLNVITAEVRPQFIAAIEKAEADENLRALILTGQGDRSFCAGADLKEEEELTSETVRRFLEEDRQVYDRVEQLSIPVIAAINGYCMGGGFELALACDIRLAVEEAKFCAAGVKVGLVVSTARLTRLLGPARAKDLILTGRTIQGLEAERMGLVSRSVPHARLGDEALSWAQTIAERAPLAVGRAKHTIDEAADLPFVEAMSHELDDFAELSATRDHKHAISAFFRKEETVFFGE